MIFRLGVAVFSALTSLGAAAVFPNQNWEMVTPAEAGLDEAKLFEARDYAITGGG